MFASLPHHLSALAQSVLLAFLQCLQCFRLRNRIPVDRNQNSSPHWGLYTPSLGVGQLSVSGVNRSLRMTMLASRNTRVNTDSMSCQRALKLHQ
jgi:hypothetical protein